MVLDAPPLENTPTRILIIDTAWLGDVVFSTSLVGAVHKLWPNCEIDFLTAPRGEAILHGHPDIRQLWVFDKHDKHRSIWSMAKFSRQLQRIGYDIILNAHPSLRSRILTIMIGAPIRVGYKGFAAKWCLTNAVSNDLGIEPDHVRRRINLLRALGYDANPAPLRVAISDDELSQATLELSHRGLSAPLLGIVPGSAWATKKWDIENYKGLASRWLDDQNGGIIVVGGDSERIAIDSICRLNPENVIPVVSAPLSRVAAYLSKCEVVVGNDTGVSFLAIAAGAQRVIVLYGCTQVNYDFPPPHLALTAGVPCCLPRTGHGAHHCRWSDAPWCMTQISVDRVWKEIEGQM